MDRIRKIFTGNTVEASGETFVRLYDALSEITTESGPNYVNQRALLEQLGSYGITDHTRKVWMTKNVTKEQWDTIQHLLLAQYAHTIEKFMMEKKETPITSFKLPIVQLPSKGQSTAPSLQSISTPDVEEDEDEEKVGAVYHSPSPVEVTLNAIFTMMRTLDVGADMERVVDEFYSELRHLDSLFVSKRAHRYADNITDILEEHGWNGTAKKFADPTDRVALMHHLILKMIGNNILPKTITTDVTDFNQEGYTMLVSAIDKGCDLNELLCSFIVRTRNYQYSWLARHFQQSFYQNLIDLGWTDAGFLDERKNIRESLRSLVEQCTLMTNTKFELHNKVVHPKINTSELVHDILTGLINTLMSTDDIDMAATDVFDVQGTINDLIHMEPIIKYETERVFILLSRLGMFTAKEVGTALQLII